MPCREAAGSEVVQLRCHAPRGTQPPTGQQRLLADRELGRVGCPWRHCPPTTLAYRAVSVVSGDPRGSTVRAGHRDRRSRERAIAGRTDGMLELDDQVTWQAQHVGIPGKITVRITELDRPRRFVDQQVTGPFESLRHLHDVEPTREGTSSRRARAAPAIRTQHP